MKKLLLLSFVVLISYSFAMSQIIATESFDYEDLLEYEIDGEADGGVGWAGPWEVFAGDPSVFIIDNEGELPDGIDIATTGYRLKGECIGTEQRAYRPLANPIVDDGSIIWISFILESENAIGASWQGVSLWSPGGEGEQSLFGKNWTPMTYGAVFRGTGVDSDTPVEDNVPVWLVVKIELSGDDSEEEVFFWVNPDPTTEPDISDANATVSGLLNNGATHIACHFGNTAGIVAYFDELMLANTFEEVVPKKAGVGIFSNRISSKMSTCYPNPFNTSTTIKYTIAKNEMVSLDIYNAVGEKMETLMNGMQDQGNYSVQWNAANYTSGIYFYKLTVGNNTETNKITLK